MAWTQTTVNHFKTLGVRETADEDRVIKRAYREKALLHHSDRGGDNDEMVRVNAAYEVLRTREGRECHRAELMRIRRRAEGTAFGASQRAPSADASPHPPTAQPREYQHSPSAAKSAQPPESTRDGSLWLFAIVWGLGTAIATGLKVLVFSIFAMCVISALAFNVPTGLMIVLASSLAGVAAVGGFSLRVCMVMRGELPTE